MSQKMHLNQAIYEITDSLSIRDFPFYFIVGAGISYDSVPLAKDIIELCKTKLKKSNIPITIDENLKGAEEYSFWLDKAYHQPISRQRFFRDLIENKNITPANFRLAHLLAYSKLANIVITPNFDDFLTRALNHFNVKHIVCDQPESAFKVNNEIEDIQIVHVHGTYLSYDCCNLTPEIIARNKGSEITTNTIASLLERISESISPIVVGYSGWENDVIMTSLRKRLQSRRLPFKLYWFCYSDDQLNNFPEWLVNHTDVAFVVPENKDKVTIIDDTQEIEKIEQVNQIDTKLSAHVVLDKLVNALDLPEPEITEDPLSFLIKFLGGNRIDEKSKDVFFLNHVIEKLKNLKSLEQENEGKDNQNLNLFKNIRGFARRSQYNTAARLLLELNYENLSNSTLLELLQVIVSILERIDEDKDSQLILKVCNCFEDIVNKLKEKDAKNNFNDLLIMSFEQKATYFKNIGDEQNVFLMNEKIINLSSEKGDPNVNIFIVEAIFNNADYLMDSEPTKSLTMFESLIQNFETENDEDIQPYLRSSASRLIKIYFNLGDYTNAHKYCDYLIKQSDALGEIAEPFGLYYKIRTFINEGNLEEAALVLQTFESKFIKSTNEDILVLLIIAIRTLGASDNSLYSIDKIIGFFRDSKLKRVKKLVAETYFDKAFYFYQKGDQLTAADNFVKSFEYGMTIAGVNIFYLLRKEGIQQNIIPFTMEELITPKLNENEPFAIVNQALYLIESDERNWVEADNLISKIKESPEYDKLDDVESWWYNLSISEDTEGDLVLAWLVRHRLIEDPQELSIRDRLEKVNQWKIPDFMFSYADEVSFIEK
ncbi:SIR2 family protein [Bacillus sp. USDA818B3_A]|uniref:SIR2 family protein n=1 Tax=Bacillus sp. USDA818B3_A TaxID=2698834 RepID=UPI00136873A1|nr:SIR2 family protein [Bacillus sp. USDA818B3_A]